MASHPFENPEVLRMPYAVHALQTYTMLRERPAKATLAMRTVK